MPEQIKTVLVCYTQTTFDNLAPDPEEESEDLVIARQIVTLADNLTLALKTAGLTAEQVKVPQRSFEPRDVAKAAFGWRLLDLSESNGVKIELVICLDFPAWSVNHSNKVCWLLNLPNFVMRTGGSLGSTNGQQTIASLLQAERRGLSEAKRVLAGSREIAQELARSGLQTEFNPLPPSADPAGTEWQLAIKRLVSKYASK